ncbi:MAG: alpha/beta hydrolase [Gammaproteobacteria bacterium]|nr:alpha/beta hydrolase [Gammaproteobacteria bacterium]
MSVNEHLLDINGTRIYAIEEGQGPLVLLVHGFPELAYSWRHQLPALAAAGYRAVAIEQRGYGRSSKFWRPDAYRIDHLVDDVVGVVRALGESKAVVVGHDWGAPVAWSAAWMHPEVFRGVVGMSVPFAGQGLIGVPGNPFGEHPLEDYQRELAGPGQDFYHTYWSTLGPIIDEIEADLAGWIGDIMYSVSGEGLASVGFALDMADPITMVRQSAVCIAHGTRMRDRFLPARPVPWLSATDLAVYVEAFQRSGLHGPLSFYRNLPDDQRVLAPYAGTRLAVPAYFIGGEFDVATWWGAESRARAHEVMADYRGEAVLPKCGHWIQQERPAETNRLLLDFLAGLD